VVQRIFHVISKAFLKMETMPSDVIAKFSSHSGRSLLIRPRTFADAPRPDPRMADRSSRFAELDDGQLSESAGVAQDEHESFATLHVRIAPRERHASPRLETHPLTRGHAPVAHLGGRASAE
jgi:hypothetical protein